MTFPVWVCVFGCAKKKGGTEGERGGRSNTVLYPLPCCPVAMTWSVGVSPLVRADLM